MGLVTFVSDSLRNLASGLGYERDKAAQAEFHFTAMGEAQLEAMYRGDWTAGKAVDIPAFDSVRNWRNWQAKNDQIERIEAEEKRLNLRSKLLEAMVLGRLYGGGALVMGIGTDDPMKPVNLDAIKQGGLRYVHVMSRYDIVSGEIRLDPEDEWFGEPEYYQLNTEKGAIYHIHPSRVVIFTGSRRVSRTREVEPWGDSILEKIRDAVANAARANHAIAQLLEEAKLDVIKVPNLMSTHLASNEATARLTERFRTAMSIKSSTNALVLDDEESYEQKQVSFTNMPEVLQQYMLVVSGAADIPATRFLGQSPAGMNATGESDLKNYYDRVSSEQELTLTPALSRLDEVLIRSAEGARDKAIHYVWAPLFQKDGKELSEIEKNRSETFNKWSASGLVSDQVLGKVAENAMIESGQYPGVEAAIEEFGSKAEEFDPEAGDLNDPDDPANPAEPELDPETGEPVADAAPRTLYVYRKVLNGKALVAWAKRQGFKSTLKASDMRVTIAFSRKPVDWLKAGTTWAGDEDGKLVIKPGGPRIVEPLGPKGAVVLHFASNDLVWRHEDIRRSAGASWDWDDYQPHITITYQGAEDIDFSQVKPFTGKIELGPEVFEEVVENWEQGKG
ncbi:MAG: phage portal protein [Hyphomonas sp.]|uniref:anti-CBASS protein Acb1 family protein n=2 Tax=Hyphomonas sp. TaxID=87 RepID=UPI0032661ED1